MITGVPTSKLFIIFQAFLGLNGGGHSHSDSSSPGEAGGDEHDEMSGVLMGVTALTGMYLFFIMERLMVIITHWKHKKRKAVSILFYLWP